MDPPFRQTYRDLEPEERRQVALIKDQAEALWRTLITLPDNRERALAITRLEECVMWAVKAIT